VEGDGEIRCGLGVMQGEGRSARSGLGVAIGDRAESKTPGGKAPIAAPRSTRPWSSSCRGVVL